MSSAAHHTPAPSESSYASAASVDNNSNRFHPDSYDTAQDKNEDVSSISSTATVAARDRASQNHESGSYIPHADAPTSSSSVSSVDHLTGDPFALGEDFDLRRYLRGYKDTLDRDGIRSRTTGVCMRDTSIYGLGSGYEFLTTFIDIFLAPYRHFKERQVVKKAILSHSHALANAGELVMVLGQPGAGCSTYLRSVAGETEHYNGVEGSLHYDGIDAVEMKKHYPGDVLYSGENDVHFPTLTTRETINFAARVRAPRNRPCNLSRSEYMARVRDLIATSFGLTHTYKSKVGNDFVRGVSGGERKRVTISEAFALRPTIACWDNSTRGLDSSTAYEFVNNLRICAEELQVTSFVTAYQASQKIYELFDRVCVLYSGRQIYYGPASKAKDYFLDMGFTCHPRETTPDFLTAISDPTARKPKEGWEDRVPRTAEDFERVWHEHPLYSQLLREMDEYDRKWDESSPSSATHSAKEFDDSMSAATKHELYRESARSEKSKSLSKKSPYTITFWMQLRYCLIRSWQRFINDPAYIGAMAFAFMFQSFIIGSIFYNMKKNTSDMFSRGGVLFFAILFTALQSLSEIANMFAQRPIIAKHRSSALYHPAADVISSLIVDIPFRVINVTVFSIILYFLTDLRRTAGGFWTFYVFLLMGALTMTTFFRALAAIMPNVSAASALGGIGVLAIAIYTGYAIPNIDVGWWFRWISYLDPVQFGFESLMINEFKAQAFECAQMIPSGGNYDNVSSQYKVCPVVGAQPGQTSVDGSSYLFASFNYKTRQIWRNFAIIIGFYAFLIFVNVVASETLNFNDAKGEFLIFRRGYAPDTVKEAVEEGGKPLDLETGQDTQGGGVVKEAQNPEEVEKEFGSIESGRDIFSWRNLSYDITVKGEKRRLLSGVNGFVKPGKLTALMGESGAEAVEEGGKPLDLETGQDTQGGGVVKEAQNPEEVEKEFGSIESGRDIFSWRNLSYDITVKGEKRRLLSGVNGFVKPGKLTALMGESGAGKTTLLNVLAQRVDTGVVTGNMLVNGNPLDSTFQRRTGYVQQQDVHVSESTVREALQFSAALRQPASVPLSEKYEYVEKTGQDTQGGGVVKEAQNPEEVEKEFGSIESGRDIFSWRNLSYDITVKGEKRRLLSGVNGFVKPGKLTALMGESGAGKTTLLNVLAQRVDTGVVTGNMLVNGNPLDSTFQRRTGYVQQQDVHVSESTVREALQFSAALRQPASVPLSEKYEYVESVIKLLEMESYAEAIIGSPGSGLNVEQRKRATIGVELAAKPALLLFLDEPTSGLDSQSAWSIVQFLRKLTDAGQAILCTIHQPSSVLFDQFDRLLLLQKGGKTVYFGDIGDHSKTLLEYFANHGATPCPPDANPAEYILDVIGAGATAKTDRDWHEVWNNSEERKHTTEELDRIESSKANSKREVKKEDTHTYAMPLWFQIKFVLTRNFHSYWREPSLLMSKMFLNIFAGLFIGFTFYNQGLGSQNMQNKLFAVFMATVLAVPLINGLQPKFIDLRNVFEVREKPSNIYSWISFVISAILVEIPFNFVFGTIFFLCWFYPVKFYKHLEHPSDRTGYAWLMYMIFQMYYSTFGQAVASACPNAQTASVVNSLAFTFIITFNGVMQPLANLMKFWHWMHSLTPFTYIIEGLLSDLLHKLPVECKPNELSILNPPSGQTCQSYLNDFLKSPSAGNLLNPNDTSNCQYCKYKTADQFLAQFSMKFNHRWRDFGIVIGYVFFNVFAVLLLFYIFRVMRIKSTWIYRKITKSA
ncbi:hypothetical protein SPOG_03329 [Schizosaccharomyces cryophilus OY26]|uniref:ABC transporter domain-containing protein n=1 Tax=Schizosaccharomyces cryophilus (strain OY26 / ATCC MYA-4695 / CBS 11777 / NBRC 106824 / NRRL Y48691) TaxID=653667 RepID=S9WYU7_SCHCR|nr:uncharacterized protein SPOG_03329 [Schizosaccharomyces cryophilus OY26]EPY49857.1 hypothetical protein SPOG_03329 [Schizosaccharomyces cryophilus OY26]